MKNLIAVCAVIFVAACGGESSNKGYLPPQEDAVEEDTMEVLIFDEGRFDETLLD